MEMTPSSSPSKRTRAKPKVVKEPVETQSAAAKKPRAPRKTLTRKTVKSEPAVAAPAIVAEVQVLAATLEPAPEDVGAMVATAAYFLAAARNFSPGHELDDWLEAERAVHAKLFG